MTRDVEDKEPSMERFRDQLRLLAQAELDARLQGLPGGLVRQLRGGELAQRIVDQRKQLVGCARIALLDGRQDGGNFAH